MVRVRSARRPLARRPRSRRATLRRAVPPGPRRCRGPGARGVRGGRRRRAAAQGSGARGAALPGWRAAGATRTLTSSWRRRHLDAAEATLTALGYENASSAQGIDDVGGVVHARTRGSGLRRGRRVDDRPAPLAARGPGVAGRAWEALAARRTWIEVGGRRAAVLDRAGQAMHLARTPPSTARSFGGSLMSSRSRSSAGRPTSGTLPRS